MALLLRALDGRAAALVSFSGIQILCGWEVPRPTGEAGGRVAQAPQDGSRAREEPVTIALCGDVMPGRGVDQILPHPGDPTLIEGYLRDARDYVRAAEEVNGPIDCPVAYSWPWGSALRALDDARPDVRLINLETSGTQ